MTFPPPRLLPSSEQRGCFPLCLLAACLAWLAMVMPAAASASGAQDVLILITRNPSDPWAVAEADGIQRTLRRAKPAVHSIVEYMDWQGTTYDTDYEAELIQHYREKFTPRGFRVLIACDELAVEFLRRNRDTLFPHAQAVFSGLARDREIDQVRFPWLTGVLEDENPVLTYRLALQLEPDLEKFYILDDSTLSGTGNLKRIAADAPELVERVPLEIIRADTARALFTAVEHLPPRSAVLLTRSRVARRMQTELRLRCPVPVYGTRVQSHLEGSLGGAMLDGEASGAAAAGLALRLLAGESAAQIPPMRDLPASVILDHRQLVRFGIPPDRVPPGARILNEPRALWQEHPRTTAGIVGAMVLLLLTAGLLGGALQQKRRAASELHRSLSLLNATLDATADGVLAVGPASHVMSFNRRFLEMWRMPPEVAERQDDGQMLAFVLDQLKYPQQFRQRVEELYSAPGAESFDVLEFKDGRVFERRSRPQWLAGRIVGRVWTFADATERRRNDELRRKLETELAQAHKLEALGTLAGGIAHDFNNLLTAILGYTQLALDSLPGDSSTRADLETVIAASERARDLVQRILTFSRKSTPERHPVHLSSILQEAIKLLRATIPAAIEIQVEVKGQEETVLADGSQVHQAIVNLCTNAAQAIGGRPGSIVITTELVELRSSLQQRGTPGKYMCISVRDSGPGIDEAMQARIFDPFFTTKNPGQGTGLGLAVVHGIMQSHDGSVTVHSKPGQGTTFRLFFPVAEADAVFDAASPADGAAAGCERLLLVDDEESVLLVESKLLMRLGYRVETCDCPIKALEILKSELTGFDAVVTDLNMPRMSGTDFAAEIQRLRLGLPVVLATGYLGVSDIEARAPELGISEIVAKPFTGATLSAAIRRTLDRAARTRGVAA